MRHFQGSVKITGGEFRTYQELILTALDSRTFDTDDGANNSAIKEQVSSRFRAATAANVFTNPDGEIYIMDCFRKSGIVGGVTDQAMWAAVDFTAAPGGGEKLTQGKLNPSGPVYDRFDLGNRLIYAAADTVIYLDVTLG